MDGIRGPIEPLGIGTPFFDVDGGEVLGGVVGLIAPSQGGKQSGRHQNGNIMGLEPEHGGHLIHVQTGRQSHEGPEGLRIDVHGDGWG